MASIRLEVLDAFARLERRTDRTVFRLRDVVAEALNVNPQHSVQTIRTYVTSVMCSNAPVHHVNHTDDLFRVDRGMYRRLAVIESAPEAVTSTSMEAEPTTIEPETIGPAWHWEGHVQASIVTGLAADGWSVLSVADTETRVAGTDIVAERNRRRIHIEVKGYPTNTYARGDKKGEPKPTHPATQARVWFAGALMKAAMLRNDHPGDEIAIGLPSFETYRTLAERVSLMLEGAHLGLIWVQESGDVEFALDPGGDT